MVSVEIGQQISHYKILEKIGEGGMGVVYKAQDTSLNRFVALKFLPPHLTQIEENRNRFIIEAQAASALDHANICNIHEINESDDGQRFICMAYYEGESLRQKIENGPIPLDETIDIISQIAQGLKAAHDEKIIHRDIKPGNIIITKKGEVKILDFGLAKLAGAEFSKTTTSRGTAAYMCPEQIRGKKFDHCCDIWAMAVVFYEMLTGHLPFEGEYPEPIMYAIVNEEPKPLAEYVNNASPHLQSIFDKLLDKDLDKRHQCISELLEDLQILEKNDQLVLKTKPAITRYFTHKRAYLFSSIAVLLTVLVLFIIRSYLFPDDGNQKLIMVIPVENVTIGEEHEDFSDGMTAMLINDLTQVKGLDVIHRTTAMHYKGTSKSPPEISEELDVDFVVEPLFVKSGDRIKISATVFNASINQTTGAESFDGNYKDMFELFSDLAWSIAGQIDPEYLEQEQEQSDQTQQIDPRALELYLRGYSLLNKHTKSENNEAIKYFVKSIDIDSNFALPYVGLAIGFGQLMYWGDLPLDEGVPKVKKILNKALQIDDQLAETYQCLGAHSLWQLWDWKAAGEAFQRAKDLNPNLSGFSGSEYSWYLITMGYVDEAITEAERLIQVDPLFYATRYTVGVVYNFAREYDKAIELILRTIALDPEDGRAYEELAIIYEQLDRYDDAHQQRLSASKHADESPGLIAKYDSLYIKLGPRAYPTWLLMKYKNQDDWLERNSIKAAWIYARLGEIERSLDWLETAYEKKVGDMVTINIDPKWDMLREEPRFQEIVARMNFPD